MSEPIRAYRTVFMSDFHLGATNCRAEAIVEFLKTTQCEKLFLVGDIIDFWVSKRKGKWEPSHTEVIRQVLGKTRYGCEVFLTPGNHDADLRRLNGIDFSGIHVDHQFVHHTLQGKKLLVVHGDFFDRSVTTYRWLAVLGTWIYEGLKGLNNGFNILRKSLGKEPSEFSGTIKKRFKSMVSYLGQFPERISVDAKNQGYDGVVCGHIHRPKFETHESGVMYINVGDWMENCTALVEHLDGRLELVNWNELKAQTNLFEVGAGEGR